VRLSFFLACASFLVGLVAAGCYSPRVKNKGYACTPNDAPACPAGYFCVDGLCQDTPGPGVGGVGGNDMAVAVGDMSGPTPPQWPDFSRPSVPDMVTPPNPPDMVTPPAPPDMAQPTCQLTDQPCFFNSDCCSGSCRLIGICK
jgi:hypothetical protein